MRNLHRQKTYIFYFLQIIHFHAVTAEKDSTSNGCSVGMNAYMKENTTTVKHVGKDLIQMGDFGTT